MTTSDYSLFSEEYDKPGLPLLHEFAIFKFAPNKFRKKIKYLKCEV